MTEPALAALAALAAMAIATVVFGTSAASKLRSRRAFTAFRTGLSQTALIPPGRLKAAAVTLAGAEAAITVSTAVAVLTAALGRGISVVAVAALAAGAVLASVLAAGVALILRRGTRATCACFGPGSDLPIGMPHLIRNVVLLALLAAGLAAAVIGQGWPGWGAGPLAVVTGAVAGLVLVRFDDLVSLFGPVPRQPARSSRAAGADRG